MLRGAWTFLFPPLKVVRRTFSSAYCYLFVVPASEMVGHIDFFSPCFVLDKGEFYLNLLFFLFSCVRVKWLTYPLHRIIDGVELQRLG